MSLPASFPQCLRSSDRSRSHSSAKYRPHIPSLPHNTPLFCLKLLITCLLGQFLIHHHFSEIGAIFHHDNWGVSSPAVDGSQRGIFSHEPIRTTKVASITSGKLGFWVDAASPSADQIGFNSLNEEDTNQMNLFTGHPVGHLRKRRKSARERTVEEEEFEYSSSVWLPPLEYLEDKQTGSDFLSLPTPHSLWWHPLLYISNLYSGPLQDFFKNSVKRTRARLLEKQKSYALWELDQLRRADKQRMDTFGSHTHHDEQQRAGNPFVPLRRDGSYDKAAASKHWKERFAPTVLPGAVEQSYPSQPGDVGNMPSLLDSSDPLQANPCVTVRNESGIYISRWVEYDIQQYYCNGTVVTKQEYERQRPWNPTCEEKTKRTRSCFCAQDRRGSRCQLNQKIGCKVHVHEPAAKCQTPVGLPPDETVVGGVPITTSGRNCWRFKTSDRTSFGFLMTCHSEYEESKIDAKMRFSDDTIFYDVETRKNYTWSEVMGSFSYFVKSGNTSSEGIHTFALSEARPEQMRMAPRNFYNFMDESHQQQMRILSPGMYIGTQPFYFNVDFSKFDEKYYAGNRIFIEIGYPSSRSPGGSSTLDSSVSSFYADFPSLEIPGYDNTREILIYTLVPLGVILALVIIGLFLLYRWYRRRKEKKFMKPD